MLVKRLLIDFSVFANFSNFLNHSKKVTSIVTRLHPIMG